LLAFCEGFALKHIWLVALLLVGSASVCVQAKKQAVALLGAAGYEDKAAALLTKKAEDEEDEQQDWVRQNDRE
jgi:uncharacterized membrane protein (Fun14 family)